MQLISVHWFYILPLCWIPVGLLTILGWSLLGFPRRVSHHLQRVRVWLLANLDAFISFCCLIAEARTSSTMLSNSGGSSYPCRVPDPGGKAFSFSPLKMILTVGFYDIEVCSLYPSTMESVNQEGMLYFVRWFFCIYWEYHMVLVLSFINVLCHTDWFADVKPPLQTRNKSHVVMVDNPFNVLLDPVG